MSWVEKAKAFLCYSSSALVNQKYTAYAHGGSMSLSQAKANHCSSITVWFGSATKLDKNRLQRTVRTAGKIIRADLPSLEELYIARVKKRAEKIATDPRHPGHNLFNLLPSGRRYKTLYTKTSRHKNSFFPCAIKLLNL